MKVVTGLQAKVSAEPSSSKPHTNDEGVSDGQTHRAEEGVPDSAVDDVNMHRDSLNARTLMHSSSDGDGADLSAKPLLSNENTDEQKVLCLHLHLHHHFYNHHYHHQLSSSIPISIAITITISIATDTSSRFIKTA